MSSFSWEGGERRGEKGWEGWPGICLYPSPTSVLYPKHLLTTCERGLVPDSLKPGTGLLETPHGWFRKANTFMGP